MARIVPCVALLGAVGCKKEAEPEAAAPKTVAPPPSAESPPQAPAATALAGLEAGTTCKYEIHDVLTESLGGDLSAAHDVKITYTLRAVDGDAPLTFDVDVLNVAGKARRDTYDVDLDSSRAADLLRVNGGADTQVVFDVVMPFALLGKKLRITLDGDGRLLTLTGGDAVRAALLGMFPPKPRTQPFHQKQVELAASDEALAAIFLPASTLVPKDQRMAPGEQGSREVVADDPLYRAKGYVGWRVRAGGENFLVEEKRAFGPTDEPPPGGKPPGPEIELQRLDRQITVAFEKRDPCFAQAGASDNRTHAWKGVIEEQVVETSQTVSRTWIWEKKK